MKKPYILLIVGLAALLLAVLLWHSKQRPLPPPAGVAALQPSDERQTQTSDTEAQMQKPPTQGSQTTTSNISTPPGPKNKHEEVVEALSTKNHVPIVFYGKVENQFANALTNTTVNFSVRVDSGYDLGVKRGRVLTDENGFFTISGYEGESLSVVPERPGYALASLNGGGDYSLLKPESARVHPDPNNPIVIKMWKLQGAEPLLPIDTRCKLPFTGAPIVIDLIAGANVSNGGDIKLTVVRPPGNISQRNKQDWSLTVEAVDGELMDSQGTGRITYSAPSTGYQSSYTITMTAANVWPDNWFDNFNKELYVKSRNGHVYSKLAMSFTLNNNPDDLMHIKFVGIANTNSSPNWEGDPNTLKPQ